LLLPAPELVPRWRLPSPLAVPALARAPAPVALTLGVAWALQT